MKVEIGMVSGKVIVTDLYQFSALSQITEELTNTGVIIDAQNTRIIICKNIEYIEEQSK